MSAQNISKPEAAFASASPDSRAPPWRAPLPPAVAAALWHGNALGTAAAPALGSGFAALDAELPGGGWPCRSLTELLQPQDSAAEWRLLAPAMCKIAATGRDIVVVGPPQTPHPPGLLQLGLDERRLVWIRADTPAERLWAAEQLVRADAVGLLVVWLPQARPQQIRRLQVGAQACGAAVFLCRPLVAAIEPSAAPLRVRLLLGPDWDLHLQLLKRKGAPHLGSLRLVSVPGGLERLLTPRLRRPGHPIATRRERDWSGPSHAVGRAAARAPAERAVAAH